MLGWLGAAGALAVGWLGNQVRPAGRARRKARRARRRVENEARAMERLQRRARRRLERRAKAWARDARTSRLGSLSVEELRAFGASQVRWKALKDGGIETVGDLSRLRERDLVALEGLGPVSARRLRRALRELRKANAEEPVAPPSRASALESSAEQALLQATAEELETRDILGSLPSELEGLRDEVREAWRVVARGTRLWTDLGSAVGARWRRRKEDALRRAHTLVERVQTAAEPEGLLDRSRRARREVRQARRPRTREELTRDHESRFAEYTALIAAALQRRGERDPTRASLPAEIVAAIDRQPLDTRGLTLVLRGYQAFGARFLLVQGRALLGDEMGLGKTAQALAAFAHLAETGGGQHFLVVCPASVLHNWKREVERHTRLSSFLLHGPKRDTALGHWRRRGGVAVTSFRTLETLLEEVRRDGDRKNCGASQSAAWPALTAVAVDEAHYAKNPEANRTRTVAALTEPLPYVFFLTGTPFENRLDEFRSLARLLQPEVAERLGESLSVTGDLAIGRTAFRRAVAPVYLRRNQADVLRELPERIEVDEWVELGPQQERGYREAVEGEDIMAMRRAATLTLEGGRRIPTGPSAKLERLEEILQECRANGTRVLCFSFFLDVLASAAERFDAVGTITGATPPAERQALVDALSRCEGHGLLLAQIQAGGVGLNVQAASVVCLLEPQWKPSTEEQAIARAHRMGQARRVVVHRFLAKDTVDERIREILAEKAELFDRFARDSLVKEASRAATETGLVRRVVEAEKARLARTAGSAAIPERPGS